MTDGTRDLDTALDQLGALVAGLEEDDLGRPTPCTDWTVGDLAGHLVVSLDGLAAMASGRQPDWSSAPDLSAGHAAAVDAASARLRDAWASAPADASPAMACAEIATHTWDLATALGRSTAGLDAAPAEAGLAFMRDNLTADRRGDAFGAERPVPQGADAYQRIAAFAGREV